MCYLPISLPYVCCAAVSASYIPIHHSKALCPLCFLPSPFPLFSDPTESFGILQDRLPSTTPVSVFRSIPGHDSFRRFRFQEEFHISVGPVWCWGRQRSNRLRTSGSRPSPWLSSPPFHCRALPQTKNKTRENSHSQVHNGCSETMLVFGNFHSLSLSLRNIKQRKTTTTKNGLHRFSFSTRPCPSP